MTKITIEHEGIKATVEGEAASLTDVLILLEQVLKGVGFIFDGNVDIVDYSDEPEDEEEDDEAESWKKDNA